MPFAHMQQMAGGGMGNTGVEMEKQASQMSQASETEYTAAPRWQVSTARGMISADQQAPPIFPLPADQQRVQPKL